MNDDPLITMKKIREEAMKIERGIMEMGLSRNTAMQVLGSFPSLHIDWHPTRVYLNSIPLLLQNLLAKIGTVIAQTNAKHIREAEAQGL